AVGDYEVVCLGVLLGPRGARGEREEGDGAEGGQTAHGQIRREAISGSSHGRRMGRSPAGRNGERPARGSAGSWARAGAPRPRRPCRGSAAAAAVGHSLPDPLGDLKIDVMVILNRQNRVTVSVRRGYSAHVFSLLTEIAPGRGTNYLVAPIAISTRGAKRCPARREVASERRRFAWHRTSFEQIETSAAALAAASPGSPHRSVLLQPRRGVPLPARRERRSSPAGCS